MLKKHLLSISLGLILVSSPQICLGASPDKSTIPSEGKLSVSINQYSEEIPYAAYSNWTKYTPTLSYNPAYDSEIEDSSFCPADSKLICKLLFSRKTTLHIQRKTGTSVNQEAIKSYLEDLARRTDAAASDAKFKVENGKVTTFAPEQQGSKLDLEGSLPLIADFAQTNDLARSTKIFELPFTTSTPTITTGEVNSMGIATLIGEGTSNFKGSPVNRIRNIKVAVSRFDGLLIKPGEEFSFVKNLGEVDGEHGYYPELVIKNGATEPEFGGGVCQVSTTAFRAALYSGLEITARRNHAYPVSYYNPAGMDSTVYVPQPDLRFKNNTPGYILIQVKIVGTELIFDFYGTDDGRKTTIEGPTVTERQPDGAMKTTFTQRVVDKDGNEIINDVFNSSYASPYKYPHPGGPTLSVKPSNWSEEEWKAYKKTIKDMAKAAATAAKNTPKQ